MTVSKVIFLLLPFTSACFSGHNGSTSSPKYGYSDSYPQQLINVPSGGTIKVCGSYFSEIKWAISVWGVAINRIYDVTSDCNQYAVASFGPTNSYAISECARWKQQGLDLTGRMFTEPSKNPMTLIDCGYSGSIRQSILHEVGHLFGLCDQYYSQLNECRMTTSPVEGSVMKNAAREDLSADDVAGIWYLSRHEVAGMVTGAETQLAGSAIALTRGTYHRSDNAKSWVIETAVISGSMKAVFIRDNNLEWKFLCRTPTVCEWNGTRVYPRTNTSFRFVDSSGSYDFAQ